MPKMPPKSKHTVIKNGKLVIKDEYKTKIYGKPIVDPDKKKRVDIKSRVEEQRRREKEILESM